MTIETQTLIWLLFGALFGYIADRTLEEKPNIGIPTTFISLVCTLIGVMTYMLEYTRG